MWPIAVFLMLVVLGYWLAFCATIWFWGNALFALLKGHFIRASIWLCLGYGALLWWQGTEVIPHPWDFDEWLRGSAAVVGTVTVLVVVAKLGQWRYRRRQALQAVPPFGTMPTG